MTSWDYLDLVSEGPRKEVASNQSRVAPTWKDTGILRVSLATGDQLSLSASPRFSGFMMWVPSMAFPFVDALSHLEIRLVPPKWFLPQGI